jgi:hypothetical protein
MDIMVPVVMMLRLGMHHRFGLRMFDVLDVVHGLELVYFVNGHEVNHMNHTNVVPMVPIMMTLMTVVITGRLSPGCQNETEQIQPSLCLVYANPSFDTSTTG